MTSSPTARAVGPVEARVLRDLSPTFTERAVPAGGTTFRVLEGGSGPPIVLIHGRGHAATVWAPWLSPLAATRRVIVFDLPGFGSTPAGQMRPGGPETGLDYFVEPVSALLAELGAAAPVIIGHSLGGFVALELGLRGAARPAALVLIGSMGIGPRMSYAARAFFRAGPERLARALGKDLFARISPLPDHEWGRTIADLEHELCAVPGGRPIPTLAFNRLFPSVGPVYNRLDRLHEIDAPTLLLHGEQDLVFPAPAALVAASALKRGRAKILPLGHSPHLQEPEKVLAEVTAFL